MAEYGPAIDRVLKAEGGWTEDPAPTFRGIDREQRPDWEGWLRVDVFRRGVLKKGFPENALADEELASSVRLFYKREYWDSIGGDDVPSQALAERLVDFGVTSGSADAVRALQRALNALNAAKFPEDKWPNVAVDGVWGRQTRSTLRRAFLLHASGMAPRDLARTSDEAVLRLLETFRDSDGYREAEDLLCLAMRAKQAAHYLSAAERVPNLRKFARGWLVRAMRG